MCQLESCLADTAMELCSRLAEWDVPKSRLVLDDCG